MAKRGRRVGRDVWHALGMLRDHQAALPPCQGLVCQPRKLTWQSIPLAPPDADISLDLQPFVEAIYARSRYERDIDYRRPLNPALSPAGAAWLEERQRDRQQPT